MKKRGHRIRSVSPGSIAEELELEPGDLLLAIDGEEIEDIFDYEYKTKSEQYVMLVEKACGEVWELDIEGGGEDPGLTFENSLMSDYKSCSNRCVFCFIDQMPPGMRKTLYFKDDDSRLSFLQGNYITLTNMKDHDIDRIIEFRLAPINVSVHTTNPELRCRMLHNRFAGRALGYLRRLADAGIPMNGQIVLCKDLNDGEELDRTIRELTSYLPWMESVSVVPVGLSRYRKGLYPLSPLTSGDAARTIDIIEGWQKKLYGERGIHFVHASDEFYLLAGREIPEEGRYDGYPQLENGVGMLRLLDTEFREAFRNIKDDGKKEELTLATGLLAEPFLRTYAKMVMETFPGRTIHVRGIRNDFFGESITVAGLVTGQDLKAQLAGISPGSRLLLPSVMFRSGEEVFLDDITKTDLEHALRVKIDIVPSGGKELLSAMLGQIPGGPPEHGKYEPPSGEEITED